MLLLLECAHEHSYSVDYLTMCVEDDGEHVEQRGGLSEGVLTAAVLTQDEQVTEHKEGSPVGTVRSAVGIRHLVDCELAQETTLRIG